MGAKEFHREKVGSLLYDEMEHYKVSTGPLLSVYFLTDIVQVDWLVLNFSGGGLFIRAETADDTIILRDGARDDSGVNLSSNCIWRDFIGKELIYGWLGINSQGYIDTAMLGFFAPMPEVAITVVASDMKVGRLDKWQSVSE